MKKALFICCFVSSLATFLSCLKEADLPTLTTTEVSNIKTRSASSGGTVTDDGGAEINVMGVCWGTADNPTRANSKTVSLEEWNGSFDCSLFNLIPNTYYHVRAFASNRVGIAYGDEVHFRTMQIVEPKVTTAANPLSTAYTSLTVGGNVTSYDETLRILERGFCWAITAHPTIVNNMLRCGEATGSFQGGLCQLQPETLYYIRAYAVSIAGITYGNEVQFKTQDLPVLTTDPVIEFSRTTARVGGKLSPGSYDPPYFSFAGICFGTTSGSTINRILLELDPGKDGIFSFTLTDLTPGTLYYVRACFFTIDWCDGSGQLIQYGNEVIFTTCQ